MTKLLLCGEAWGAREELFEHAFVGSSGRELAKMLAEAKLAPPVSVDWPSELEMITHWRQLRAENSIELVNVFNVRPEDNNVKLFFGSSKEGLTDLPPLERGKFLLPQFLPHLEALWAKVREAQPNLIIALGNVACWALLGEAKITAIRGTLKMSPRLGVKVLPTFHPAFILRNWPVRTVAVADLEKAAREVETPDIQRIERWLTINPTLAEITEWFTRPADFYAVDIENPKIRVSPAKHTYLRDQIAMIGFARSATDAIVIPFFDPTKPNGNYWPNPRDELTAWRLADQGLRSPVPKIFQNGVFDLSHLLRGRFRPNLCLHDTMLLHHALYPEMLKGLGFLGSIYSDEIAWKTMSGRGDNLKRDE